MPLNELGARVVEVETSSSTWLARATLTNFLRGLRHHPNRLAPFRGRLNDLVERTRAMVASGAPVDADLIQSDLTAVLSAKPTADGPPDPHFLDTGRPVTDDLDCRAVSIQSSRALEGWFPGETTAIGAVSSSAMTRDLCARFPIKSGPAKVGARGGIVWLTPYKGAVQELIERGKTYREHSRPVNDAAYGDLADQSRDLMGLSHHQPGAILLALVSRLTIGELLHVLAPGAVSPETGPIMAPTVVEGRGHGRWRHWPGPYGRTYALSKTDETLSRVECGALEAVSGPIPLHLFGEAVFLGQVTRKYVEADREFAETIGVDRSVPELLAELQALINAHP